ncbi:MAG: DUF6794 domain-containing protein [Candidatus Angelobacter sp.]
MKTAYAALLAVILWPAVPAPAQKPKTVDEAVQVLKAKWLKPKDLDWILRNPKDEIVSRLYRPFGTGVRNQFGLWGDNESLHDSCGTKDPEGCSVVIFQRLWESVRGDADPALVRQLDCQFELVNAIHVSIKGFHQATTRDMIRRLQSQIDKRLSTLPPGTTPCQTSLTLEVAGKPDLGCFVVAPHGKEAGKSVNDMTLDQALGTLGFQNLFHTVHNPPKLTVEFARKCQFPNPFPY